MKKTAVIRPQPAADVTVAALEAAGAEAFAQPLFEVVSHDWKAPDPTGFDGLLITSANALHFGGPELDKLKGLPVYAVGTATATAAQRMGFKVKLAGRAGVDKLLKAMPHDLKLIHLVAEDRLEYRLVWQKVEPITVYSSRQVENFDPAPLAGNVVMVHSPRAAQKLAGLVDDKSSIDVVAISAAAASHCGEGWRSVTYPPQPDAAQMVALAAELCDKSKTE